MARWKPFVAVAAVALLATTPYPDIVRANFMSACTADGKAPEVLCACVYRNIEREMTLEEFMVFDQQAMADPDTPPPQQMRDIGMACVADNNY